MIYKIAAQDPGGLFFEEEWATAALPRVGEQVMLPEDEEGGEIAWQEMSVSAVLHPAPPNPPVVWLGGSEGWEEGSVAVLFRNARAYRRKALNP